MKQSLSLRTSQHLALTPQLQQSIRLLQLSTLEMAQEVEQMLDDNPFLERESDDIPREEFGLTHANTAAADESHEETAPRETDKESEREAEPDWEGDGTVQMDANDAEYGNDAPAARANEDAMEASDFNSAVESLTDHLHRQALALRLDATDRAALRFLIESLNDDGYLEDSLESLTQGLTDKDDEQLLHHFTVAFRLLQNLEPTGVGARNLSECLCLQLRALQHRVEDDGALHRQEAEHLQTALLICQQPLDSLAKRDIKRLSQQCKASEDSVRAAITLIGRLEPRPGRRFAHVERNIVVPDVIVSRTTGRNFSVRLNPEVMPRLKLHDVYANALKKEHAGLSQRLTEARWFIKNIQQRFDTILRVSRAIVERQHGFFTHGEMAMRPLVLREIADELGLHESTISRVTTAKYMATPYGTFELKYFFGSGLGTDTGGNASSTAVRALIKQFVAAESAAKPLSDNQLADMLKEQGITCARRTVAKYRDALKIAPANLRKTL